MTNDQEIRTAAINAATKYAQSVADAGGSFAKTSLNELLLHANAIENYIRGRR